jgi:hypothetical protein
VQLYDELGELFTQRISVHHLLQGRIPDEIPLLE